MGMAVELGGLQICLREIVSDIKHWHSCSFGRCVREAVPHVKARRVPAFSVAAESFEEDRNVIAAKRDDSCLNFGQKLIDYSATILSEFDGDDHLGFRYGRCADSHSSRFGDLSQQFCVAGFAANYGHNRGRIQDQTGSPNSP
jgi:hypothetical protein